MARTTPRQIGSVLPAVLRQVRQQHSTLQLICSQWRRLAGTPLAAHTSPVGFQRGRLIVQVDGPGEGFLLSYQRPQLLARLRQATQGRVEDIVIRPGEPRGQRARKGRRAPRRERRNAVSD